MRCPLAENGAANPDMRRAMRNRNVIVRAHAHAQTVNAIAPGDLGQEIKMRCRVFISRRDTHQAGNAKTVLLTAGRDEPVSVSRRCAGFLRLFAGIDLQIQIRIPPLRLDFTRKYPRKFDPVHGMDRIKQGNRILGLVGLQGTNQMHMGIGKGLPQRRPLLLRFLNSVFTKHPLARLKDGNDRFGWKGLADRDKRNGVGRAPRISRDGFNPGTDGLKCAMGAGVWRCAHGS